MIHRGSTRKLAVLTLCASVVASVAWAATPPAAQSAKHRVDAGLDAPKASKPARLAFKTFRLPHGVFGGGGFPTGGDSIIEGSDGNIWFEERDRRGDWYGIGRITPSGRVTSYPRPSTGAVDIIGLAAGPDGAVWFTSYNPSLAPPLAYTPSAVQVHPVIGRINESGVITLFPLPQETPPIPACPVRFANCETAAVATQIDAQVPEGIVTGPDGNLWAVGGVDAIWRITPAGSVTAFHTPVAPGHYSWPDGIAVGSDGALWVTESEYTGVTPPDKFARITPLGQITESATAVRTLTGPIIAGADHNLWFAGIGFIGKMTPNGKITRYPLGSHSEVSGLALGPDGNVWFADSPGLVYALKVGSITASGRVTQHNTGHLGNDSTITGIARGPGRTLWLDPSSYGSLIRVTIPK